MNIYDSERIIRGLKESGYTDTSSLESADLIILNTCTIRAKAEHKAFSFLGRLAEMKREKPDLIIGVGGCVAQQKGRKILSRVPEIDFVFGTHAIHRLPEIIHRIESERVRIADIELSDNNTERFEFGTASHCETPLQTENVTRFVTIMQGCDNFCAYCVVPFVRGREVSRHPENIIREIKELVKSGVKEITLLGQNVNSYGQKQEMCSFAELLSEINKIDGLLRIRFTTSHPKDLSHELIDSFRELDKLCRHIHLPVQSGSDKILKMMNRKYTGEAYLERVDRLRQVSPDIAITSDFIVGFPGETESDFNNTLDLIKEVEYDTLFAFKYSDRPQVPSALFHDKISEDEKEERLDHLLKLQENYTLKKNQLLVGTIQEILVEGHSKKESAVQWTGRTSTNKIVNFIQNDVHGNQILTGKMIKIRIKKALPHSLWGEIAVGVQL